MLKHKTSVLFINNSGKEKKAIRVPTTLLVSWRKYLAVTLALIIVLCASLCFLIFKKTSSFYSLVYKNRLEHANRIKNEIDVDKVKASFKSIDRHMQQINQLLTERGLSKLALENAGGPETFDITDINEVAAFYETELGKAEDVIRHTPIGRPHPGDQTSGFGHRYNPFGSGSVESHSGLDFRGAIGETVKTTADGVVAFAGTKGGYGNCVIVQHQNGFQTLYGHLSKINVTQHQKIKSGEKIGEVGSTGRSTGPHLHYEVLINGVRTDPSRFTKL
ncbi:M23 family metallopeptidase [Niabella drilacis]|uniref:Murein DD-endopeptidase MepM and murein hydrolase activator NlpD, contain LysM domain n=1 Tax=Niabella drilacis (strain DSM 25811 / CCM 8410 / CCUG 62505 / LMG 26954 / E90) TaxID=1285928 RepID=A0A1G7A0M9_NIADE|nr:M23 family metallopeptidase [Niabella drilacis]SDE07615.1 Murein DD-endopeptidase MepM and murein hydrolase activator NlpD, contain LysM domain [Niabella drilacis]